MKNYILYIYIKDVLFLENDHSQGIFLACYRGKLPLCVVAGKHLIESPFSVIMPWPHAPCGQHGFIPSGCCAPTGAWRPVTLQITIHHLGSVPGLDGLGSAGSRLNWAGGFMDLNAVS